jgi:hypothetical protein
MLNLNAELELKKVFVLATRVTELALSRVFSNFLFIRSTFALEKVSLKKSFIKESSGGG